MLGCSWGAEVLVLSVNPPPGAEQLNNREVACLRVAGAEAGAVAWASDRWASPSGGRNRCWRLR